jgi:hypothetical protein
METKTVENGRGPVGVAQLQVEANAVEEIQEDEGEAA